MKEFEDTINPHDVSAHYYSYYSVLQNESKQFGLGIQYGTESRQLSQYGGCM
jgi:hypothetical protein